MITEQKVRLYKGLFSVTLIAVIMTIFELIFYIYIINPNIDFFIKELLQSQKQGVVDTRLDHLLSVLKMREKTLINDVTFGSYMTIVVEIFFMLSFLAYIYMKILSIIELPDTSSETSGITTFRQLAKDPNIKDIVVSSLSVIFILISFQTMFFYFGLNYYYIGRFGVEEIKVIFADVYQS